MRWTRIRKVEGAAVTGRFPRIMEAEEPYSDMYQTRNVEEGDTKKQTGSRWRYDPISGFIFRSN